MPGTNLNDILQSLAVNMQYHDDHLRELIKYQKEAIVANIRGGFETFKYVSLLATPQKVKGEDGKLYGFWAFNAADSIRYIKFFTGSGNNAPVVAGARAPWITMGLPAGSGAIPPGDIGAYFHDGLWVAATTGMADTNDTAPSANEILINVFFK
jgi:hypothetical protein